MEIQVHSLSLLNISDHSTRSKAQKSKEPVVGFLLGTQEGRKLEIWNSCEILFQDLQFDNQWIQARLEDYKKIFPDLDTLGWYRVGPVIDTSFDTKIRLQMDLYNENPIFLLVHPATTDPEKLPVSCYETTVKMQQTETAYDFTPVPIKIATNEGERISVDQMTKFGSSEQSHSQNLNQYLTAVQLLRRRLEQIVQAIDQNKITTFSQQRKLNTLVNQLPEFLPQAPQSEDFSDALLNLQMSAITKGLSINKDLVDKVNKIGGMERRHMMFF